MHAYQYDEFQLTGDLGIPFSSKPTTPAQLAYTEVWRNLTRTVANADVIGPARSGTAAMLPACYKHCNT